MAVLLDDLVARLMEEVPEVDGTPTDQQYEAAVKDAVADFSRRCGTVKIATLNIIAGTASYELPDDFLTLIALHGLFGGRVINSANGLIPIPDGFNERYTVRGRTITFTPTPFYTLARDYRYKAGWSLTPGDGDYESDVYADMGEEEAAIILIKAKGLCVEKMVGAAAGNTGKYSLGAVSVDNSVGLDSQIKLQYALYDQYAAACTAYNGTVAMYGDAC